MAREVAQKLRESKKVKNVRLMKNLLSDDCLPSLLECLHSVDILNLAQNSFSSKIMDHLLEFAKVNSLSKKSIQLGQNSINSKKCTGQLEELKQLGISITL